ncbi:zinc ribbon domain-containing protein [Piscinibacter koreensis]|uniref:Zinc ribbon domain-containing protein n=1 Tax=Piscinibacter koreensis TaxID=2742824 RepID=A0A7Y6NKM6_9BURK|nr:zinc ribbon domain-containing protein [Schlegelella koreensis]NUZ04854.1 zinc ribbon domain-containing protein [Schlegelella koreensis]
MAYEYGSGSKTLELPNPYQLQNRLLALCAVLLAGAGVTCLFWAQGAMQESALGRVAAPLLVGLALLSGGVVAGATASTRLRFFFGRGRPKSLAEELPPGVTGTSPRADALKELMRQGGLTYEEPVGAVEGLLYHWVPTLITAPSAVQQLARRTMFNLAAIAATLLSFIVSWLVFGSAATRPWIGILYFVFGVVFLLRPVWTEGRARVSIAALVGLVAAAILAPVAIGLVAPHLPSLGNFSVNTQTFVMLGAALVACALSMAAVLAQVDAAPQTRASVEQHRLSMNAPPAMLMDELDRILQAAWTERIPNRRYARIDPATDASTPSGAFAGELLQESQPIPVSGTRAPTFAVALQAPRYRALLALDVFATVLVALACAIALVFVHGFDVTVPWQQNRFSLAGTSAILALVAMFCFQSAARLWGRFNFESMLTWVELMGSYQTSRIGTGNNFSSRMNTDNTVVRTESMTLRVWRARIESVVFGKDAPRQVTAMFSTDADAQALAADLMQFARSQSVLVAPFSGEDETRIAALNAGERAMLGPGEGASAAQVQHHLRTAAALAGGSAASAPAAPATRFCPACGHAVTPGARFCANCAAPLTTSTDTERLP